MVIYVLAREDGEEGPSRLWFDLTSPLRLERENKVPYRLAVRARSDTVSGQGAQRAELWMRFSRSDAHDLRDQLDALLEETASAPDAAKIMKKTKVGVALNGGVNTETGDMVLVFAGKSGLEHHVEIPYDQSGMMASLLDVAATKAGAWQDETFEKADGKIRPLNIQPREAEFVLLGEEPESGRPLLVARLAGGHQFSFLLDRKMLEQIQHGSRGRGKSFQRPADPLGTVAEDIEWFADRWCTLFEPPSNTEIRQGVAALRRLLIDDALGAAWRDCGFEKQPKLVAPDLDALLAHRGGALKHVVSLVVGNATLDGVEYSAIGVARRDNPSTHIPADAEEGFAVETFHVSRDARSADSGGELSAICQTEMSLTRFLDAPGAVRLGTPIRRRDIIRYFASSIGGVHVDGLGQTPRRRGKASTADEILLADLLHKLRADIVEGLYFVVLSIGQAIGRSEDLRQLARTIRSREAESWS